MDTCVMAVVRTRVHTAVASGPAARIRQQPQFGAGLGIEGENHVRELCRPITLIPGPRSSLSRPMTPRAEGEGPKRRSP